MGGQRRAMMGGQRRVRMGDQRSVRMGQKVRREPTSPYDMKPERSSSNSRKSSCAIAPKPISSHARVNSDASR